VSTSFAVAKFTDSEISKVDDYNFSALEIETAINALFDNGFGDVVNDMIVSGFAVTQSTTASMDVNVGTGLAYSRVALSFLSNAAAIGLTVAAASSVSNRIDIVEIAFNAADFNEEERAFINASTSTVAYDSVNTRTLLGITAQIKTGIPGSGVAPTVDSGYVKIAEILVPFGSTSIIAANIFNVTATYDGCANSAWTSGTTATFYLGSQTQNKLAFLTHQGSKITSSNTVHGIMQGSGNGFDADTIDGFHCNQTLLTTASPYFAGLGIGAAADTTGTYVLKVAGASYFSGAITGASILTLTGAATLNSTLSVASYSTLTGCVGIGGAYNTSYALYVTGASYHTGAITGASILTLTGAATLNSTLSVASYSTLTGCVGIGGAYNTSYALYVTGASYHTGAITGASILTLTGAATLNSTLSVASYSTLTGCVGIGGAYNTSYALYVTGASYHTGAITGASILTLTGAATLNSTLSVASYSTLTGCVGIGGAYNTSYALYVTGTVYATGGVITASATLSSSTSHSFGFLSAAFAGYFTGGVITDVLYASGRIYSMTGLAVVGAGTQSIFANTMSTAASYTLFVYGTSCLAGACTIGGVCTAVSFTTSSDSRLKKNIREIDYGLKDVMKVSMHRYEWDKEDALRKTDIGVIAQEIKEVIPESVLLAADKYYTVEYDKLVPVLWTAVRELKAELDELKVAAYPNIE
jgi:hypothetical protein